MTTTSVLPEPFARQAGAIRAISVFPDGERILVGGDDPVVRTLELRSGAVRGSLARPEGQLFAAAATADDRIVLIGSEDTTVWTLGTSSYVAAPRWGPVTDAAVSAGGTLIVTVDSDVIRLWELGGGGQFADEGGLISDFGIRAITTTADGERIIVGGYGPQVRILHRSGGEYRVLDGHEPDVFSVSATPDGRWVATLDGGGAVRLWDTAATRPEPVTLTGHAGNVLTVAVSPDGRQVIAGDLAGTILVWDRGTPAVPAQLGGHGAPLTAFAVTPDSMRLVSGAQDGTVRLWDLTNHVEVDVRRPPRHRPTVASDRESAVDLLGFRHDVDGMATLIADRKTDAPLAIALLGRWGSGKSSFMRQLQGQVASLTGRSRSNPKRSVFAGGVRQVRFNAWHYADDHLWAGLLDHLFAELSNPEAAHDPGQVREERNTLRATVRNLTELAGRPEGVSRVLALPKLVWSASAPVFASRQGRLLALGLLAVLAASTVTVLVLGVSKVAAVLGALATVVAVVVPVFARVRDGWRAVGEFTGKRWRDLDGELRDARVRLARLDAAQRLELLIEEARTGQYQQYRGLVGRAHEDLRRLSDTALAALREWEEAESDRPPPLERIVLYIDDLDRCPPRKVVDVLAAVHLLLALPLFVVVVAVDPRWLRHCLDQHHLELFGGTTPADYLDKIFQVVFALRPMGEHAGAFIDALVPVDTGAQLPSPSSSGTGGPVTGPGSGGVVRSGETSATPPGTGAVPAEPSAPQPDQLRLRAEERDLVKRLRSLLDTPRAVKRLVNLYRLVRAEIPHEDLDEFIGDGAGPFRVDLVLLAVSVSAPSCAATLLTELLAEPADADIAAVVERLAGQDHEHDLWRRLLKILREQGVMHGNLATYCERAGTVARFSFETWHLTAPAPR